MSSFYPAQSPFQGPTGASKREGPTPGQTAAHEYPIAPLSAWQPNTSDQATFPGYRSLESSKNCLLQPPGAQCDMMGHHMAPLETSVYGAPETGAADEVYGSKMMTMADYKVSWAGGEVWGDGRNSDWSICGLQVASKGFYWLIGLDLC